MGVRATSGYGAVQRAIDEERCVVLDGGVATELPHRHGQDEERPVGDRGAGLQPGRGPRRPPALRGAGVGVLTTNTWGLPTALAGDGQITDDLHRPVHWMEVARRGVRVARQAIAEGGREGECAVAFALNGDLDGPDGAENVSLLRRALADDPPDLFVVETLSVVRPSLFAVVGAMLETSVPVWLSFRRCRHGLCGVYGQHWGGPEGDAFGRAARRFEDMGLAALLVNCIPPDHVDGMVSYLRDFTDLPLGAYPNLGYYTNAAGGSRARSRGDDYAEMALRWRAEGAQIIGGCCGTRPEHIAAAADALSGTRPGRERHGERSRTGEEPRRRPRPAPGRTAAGRPLHPLAVPADRQAPGRRAVDPRHAPAVAPPVRGRDGRPPALPGHRQRAGPARGAARAQRRRARARARRRRARGREHARQRVPQRRLRARERRDRRPLPVGPERALRADRRQPPAGPRRPGGHGVLAPADRLLGPRPGRPGDRQAAARARRGGRRAGDRDLAAVAGAHQRAAGRRSACRRRSWRGSCRSCPRRTSSTRSTSRHIEELSDAYQLDFGGEPVLVTYLLEIRRANGRDNDAPPWST